MHTAYEKIESLDAAAWVSSLSIYSSLATPEADMSSVMTFVTQGPERHPFELIQWRTLTYPCVKIASREDATLPKQSTATCRVSNVSFARLMGASSSIQQPLFLPPPAIYHEPALLQPPSLPLRLHKHPLIIHNRGIRVLRPRRLRDVPLSPHLEVLVRLIVDLHAIGLLHRIMPIRHAIRTIDRTVPALVRTRDRSFFVDQLP